MLVKYDRHGNLYKTLLLSSDILQSILRWRTNATLIDSTFEQNSALIGGVLTVVDHSSLQCRNDQFSENTAIYGGVIFIDGNSFIDLFHGSLERNKAEKVGLIIFDYQFKDEGRFLEKLYPLGGAI